MIDIEHVNDAIHVVNAIADAVLTSSGPPLTGKRRTQRRADAMRVLRQRAEQELDACRGS